MASLLVTVLLLLSGFLATGAAAQDLVAELDYGTFEGAYSASYNISYWQKIPFAQPPVGDLRFRGPLPPLPITNGTFNSSQPFDMCPQRTVNGSEDCLYLGLYSRPWTQGQPLRPVVVVFYGGAFIQGSAYFTIPPSAYPILNVSSETDLIFIYPNYRTNAFGFLPGREVAEDSGSDLNPGLLDQDAAIRWAKEHVSHFGGDPDSISIWGQSAGGGSVVAQAIAREGAEDRPKLFKRALASSPFWPKTYDYDAPQAQAVYDQFSTLAGCGTGAGSLECLKRADLQTLRNASLVVAASHTYNSSSYTWAPVIDGTFLTKRLSEAAEAGEVNMEYGWGMYNTHEGENFIPPGLANANNTGTPPFNSSTASFDNWLSGFMPGLSQADLEEVKAQYPESGTAEAVPSYNSSYTRAGLIYRDSILACPAYWMAGASPNGSYLGEYSISPAKHGSDTIYWNQVNTAQTTDPLHYKGYAGAFASFFMTSDPNALKLTGADEPGVPPLLSSGKEFNINAAGLAQLELAQFQGRCDFWKSVAPKIPI
ncbi:hypothetical protein N8I77_004284 [Diaporthe amygdali]|uniref:Carboxylic ester hydrolase n=1 Tax=Phomopsis amygdali TaxID=1214568 RepID=A0AAD9SKZ6_PHOAM|nr:hypothetical protein N8I77_004284 [Diaporthe amygdali]